MKNLMKFEDKNQDIWKFKNSVLLLKNSFEHYKEFVKKGSKKILIKYEKISC